MAEGPPAASKETVRKIEQRPDKDEIIKQVFSSALWYNPVHKYIADIVQSQCHSVYGITSSLASAYVENRLNIDYQPDHKWICFQWYCDTVRLPVTFLFSHAYQYIILYRFLSSWSI